MNDFGKWKHLHDEIKNSPQVQQHHQKMLAAQVYGKHDEAEKHRQAYAKAWADHPKSDEYKRLSSKL